MTLEVFRLSRRNVLILRSLSRLVFKLETNVSVTWIFSISGVFVTFWRNLQLLSSWKYNKPRGIMWYITDTRNREQERVKGQKECMGTTKEKKSKGEKETKERREVRCSPTPKFLVYPSDWGESVSVYSYPGDGGIVSSQNFGINLTNYSARYPK